MVGPRLYAAHLLVLTLGCVLAAIVHARPLTTGGRLRDCPDCPEMVVIPQGAFSMGSTDAELEQAKAAFSNPLYKWIFTWMPSYEQPKHFVSLQRPFALGRYMVTQGEFAVFVQATGYQPQGGCHFENERRASLHKEGSWSSPGFPQSARDPVVCVNVADAEAYIAWLNKRIAHDKSFVQQGPYRLPSEAEWEYAARAGTTTQRWWGDQLGTGNADCDGCGSPWDRWRTAPVDRFPDNPFGISGVLGNAWEWTGDCWNPSFVSAPIDGSRWSTGDCKLHVIRGDSAFSTAGTLRSAARSHAPADERASSKGFRVARDIAPAAETD